MQRFSDDKVVMTYQRTDGKTVTSPAESIAVTLAAMEHKIPTE